MVSTDILKEKAQNNKGIIYFLRVLTNRQLSLEKMSSPRMEEIRISNSGFQNRKTTKEFLRVEDGYVIEIKDFEFLTVPDLSLGSDSDYYAVRSETRRYGPDGLLRTRNIYKDSGGTGCGKEKVLEYSPPGRFIGRRLMEIKVDVIV